MAGGWGGKGKASTVLNVNSLSYNRLRVSCWGGPGAHPPPGLSLRQNLGDSPLPHRQGGQGGECGEGEQRGEDLPYGEAVRRHGRESWTTDPRRAVTRVTGSP